MTKSFQQPGKVGFGVPRGCLLFKKTNLVVFTSHSETHDCDLSHPRVPSP